MKIIGFVVSVFIGDCDENTGNCRALRIAVGSRHIRCRFPVLQKSVLGTADREHRNCFGIHSFLLKIPQASMRKARRCIHFLRFEPSNLYLYPNKNLLKEHPGQKELSFPLVWVNIQLNQANVRECGLSQ
jgi:hypothetical protein